ncbi:hypothetical protein STCU_03401 [Strigomonas culicis]|nr:hypothetical protein STCU_03401 [Strigomonas culicis]|eukprot:EPY31547.1 hypothetical protein STCU_03401 [Strigomonas culicis]
MLAYDIANAQAVEAYARRWWARIPLLGRRAREGLEAEAAAAASPASALGEGVAAAAAAAAESSRRGGGNMKVERRSALDVAMLQQAAGQPKVNTWLFKRRHPGWVPLLQRWWVPWVCTIALVGVWTPDVWKLRTLYYCDYQYAMLRQTVHKAYWRATMKKEDYEALMADIEAQRPSSVKASDCPF